ncbi:hypothetical protein [Mycobacterium hubeiense]|uniref:hypothetical protein n=1 Tax=Mycobacterium hubeiense TaxID=1867256 RepID=UPI000C7F568E|nr:hypothetical protein [Mycobacterium sp. QGD 101]
MKLLVSVVAALLAAAVSAAPAAARSYGSNGVFGVNAEAAAGWATAYIPPGRYRVDQAPSMPPYQSAPGSWVRCRAFPCGYSFGGNIIAVGHAIRDVPTFMDIAPSDAAVALYNVTLTPA